MAAFLVSDSPQPILNPQGGDWNRAAPLGISFFTPSALYLPIARCRRRFETGLVPQPFEELGCAQRLFAVGERLEASFHGAQWLTSKRVTHREAKHRESFSTDQCFQISHLLRPGFDPIGRSEWNSDTNPRGRNPRAGPNLVMLILQWVIHPAPNVKPCPRYGHREKAD